MGRRLDRNHHLKLPDLRTAQGCPVGMLERHHLLSPLLRKDNDRRVGKMPACEAHQDHHRIINLVKGRPSRQLGLGQIIVDDVVIADNTCHGVACHQDQLLHLLHLVLVQFRPHELSQFQWILQVPQLLFPSIPVRI